MIYNWMIYILWAVFVVSLWVYNSVDYKHGKFTWCSFLGVVPLLSIIVFSYVFIFNRGSSVAQLSESHKLWSIWFDWWLPLLALNLINCLIAIIAIFIKNSRINTINVLTLKLLIVSSSVVSFYHVLINMPDA